MLSSFIGLGVIAATVVFFAVFAAFVRRHENSRLVQGWLLAELASVAIVMGFAAGVALIAEAAIAAWSTHDMRQIAIQAGAIAIGAPIAYALARLIVRSSARGAHPAA